MIATKFMVGTLAVSLTVPYAAAGLAKPGEAPQGPNKVTLMALQALAVSTSTGSNIGNMVVIDTMQGREISVAPPVDLRPVLSIAPPVTLKSTT
ncbi:MAG TPA: hypothetical protein VIY51_05085 [Xanthobacteraceae bacterium]